MTKSWQRIAIRTTEFQSHGLSHGDPRPAYVSRKVSSTVYYFGSKADAVQFEIKYLKVGAETRLEGQ